MADAHDKVSLVTGVTGQDGTYLARLLRAEGRRVVGTMPATGHAQERARTYLTGVETVTCDLRDTAAMADLVRTTGPDEVYNLAAVSSVGRSWDDPPQAVATNGDAAMALLEAVVAERDRTRRDVRYFQASSADVGTGAAQSPYARGKATAGEHLRAIRERHGLHAVLGVLYIHESPLRSSSFVVPKICRAAVEVAAGRRDEIRLGNLDVVRDWGFAGDYVTAIRRTLAIDEPHDLPIGTGLAHSLGEVMETAFDLAGVADPWAHAVSDPDLVRRVDDPHVVADPEPAAAVLGWRATTTLEQLLGHLVQVEGTRLRTGVTEDESYLYRPHGP